MNLKTLNSFKAMCLVPLTALWLASAPAQAQTAPAMGPSASTPMGQMQKGAAGPHDMKASMMMSMDGMQKMPMSGDTDKDFAMMMKMGWPYFPCASSAEQPTNAVHRRLL